MHFKEPLDCMGTWNYLVKSKFTYLAKVARYQSNSKSPLAWRAGRSNVEHAAVFVYKRGRVTTFATIHFGTATFGLIWISRAPAKTTHSSNCTHWKGGGRKSSHHKTECLKVKRVHSRRSNVYSRETIQIVLLRCGKRCDFFVLAGARH